MLRVVVKKLTTILRGTLGLRSSEMIGAIRYSHGRKKENDGDFDARYVKYFCNPEIDSWECRKAMNDLLGMDLIPDTLIIIAGLYAARRLNDYALATRWLEGCKDKCGGQKDLYEYILREIRPTLCELGVLSLEEMGYDHPELALPSVFDG